MKLFITAAAAALIGTAAVADTSTRYEDMRLDTSKTADRVYSQEVRPTDQFGAQRGADAQYSTAPDTKTPDTTFSTRSNITSVGERYPYGGWGGNNDSR